MCNSFHQGVFIVSSDCNFPPPIDGRRQIAGILVHEAGAASAAPEHPEVLNLGAVTASELVAGQVSELVEFQLVRPVHLVHPVNMLHIHLEHVETLPLLVKVPGHPMLAPPPLVQVPQPLFRSQVLFREIKGPDRPRNQSQ